MRQKGRLVTRPSPLPRIWGVARTTGGEIKGDEFKKWQKLHVWQGFAFFVSDLCSSPLPRLSHEGRAGEDEGSLGQRAGVREREEKVLGKAEISR